MSTSMTTPTDDAEKSRRSPAAERARKKAKCAPLEFLDVTSMVTLLIGGGDKPVEVLLHKEVACHRSPVLRAAFSGAFLEGQEGAYKLAHVSEGTARFLVQWMYTQKLVIAQLKDDGPDWKETYDSLQLEAEETMEHLVGLWILADELQMLALQNYAMTTIFKVQRTTKHWYQGVYHHVYDNTAKSNPLRLFFADLLANEADESEMDSFDCWIPREMLMDIISNLREQLKCNRDHNICLTNYLVEAPTTEEIIQPDLSSDFDVASDSDSEWSI